MDQRFFIILVAVIYLTALLGIGFWAQKRASKASDFLVAGRKLGVVMCACTIAAVQIGAGVIVGGAENGATYSVWPGMYYSLGCGLGCIVAGIFIAGKMRDVEAVVPMDYFEARFGGHRAFRGWAWLSNVPSMLGIFVAQLLACGGILSAFGIPFEVGVVVCSLVILVYASMGGMWSVVVGDTVNIAVIMVGVPIAAIIALMNLGKTGDVSAFSSIMNTPFIPEGLLSKFIYMVAPMLVSISVSYDAFLRYQSAKDVKTAKWGCIFGGIITIIIGTAAAIIGAVGHQLYPEAAAASMFATTVSSLMTPLLSGIVVTAVLAAAMSSGNGLLICMGASFSRDFYNKILHPDKELDELPKAKLVARLTIIGACLVGIFFAFKMTNVLDAIILFNYPYMGSMLIPYYAALLSKTATVRGCFAGMVVGAIIGVGSFLAGIPGPFTGWVNPDLGLFVAYAAAFVVMMIVSSMDKNKSPMVTLSSEAAKHAVR